MNTAKQFLLLGCTFLCTQASAQNQSFDTQFDESSIEDTIKIVAHAGSYCQDIELTCPANGKEICMFKILSDSAGSITIRFINKEGKFYNDGNYFYRDPKFTADESSVSGYYFSNTDFSSENTEKIGFMSQGKECVPLLIVREQATKFE